VFVLLLSGLPLRAVGLVAMGLMVLWKNFMWYRRAEYVFHKGNGSWELHVEEPEVVEAATPEDMAKRGA
jgi:hypothetical protein